MKKCFILTVVLFVSLSSAFSLKLNYDPLFNGSVGGTFLHGTSAHLQTIQGQDSPAFRTSLSLDFDLLPANFMFKRWGFGAGVSVQFTSESLKAGNSIMQSYNGIGVLASASYFFDESFTLSGNVRLMFNRNAMLYKFSTLDVEVMPVFKIKDVKKFKINLITPVDFSYRNDSFSLRFHIGVQLGFLVGSRDWVNGSET